jgi:MFS transporter, ACS family, aldohexuronate transporter
MWLPAYLQEVRGFSLAMIGALLWIPYLCSDAGALGGAWVSSALMRRGFGLHRSRRAVLIPAAALGMLGGLACVAPGNFAVLALVSVALFGHQAWSSNLHTVFTEITPRRHVALLYGVSGAAGGLLGLIAQPLAGHAIDTAGYTPAFLGAGAVYGCALIFLLAAGVIEPIGRARPAMAAAGRD